MEQVGFYYDQTRCAGCKTCQVACKDKNKLDVGVILREVRSYQVGTHPQVSMYHVSAACNHCSHPVCMENCPVGAISKLDDGTVVQDPEACIGCRMCVISCPFGVPRFDAKERVSRKCDGCHTLREQGYQPACVEACTFRALDFGTLDELEKRHPGETVRFLPALGLTDETGPNTLIRARADAKSETGKQITL